MPSRVPIDGQVLAELREDRFWSQQRLAEQAQAFAKSQRKTCALARTQVIGYEAARLDNPKSRYPSRENLCYLVGALRPAMADLSRLLGRKPPSALAQWAADAVKPAEPVETAAPTAKESPTDRYELVHKLVPAVASTSRCRAPPTRCAPRPTRSPATTRPSHRSSCSHAPAGC